MNQATMGELQGQMSPGVIKTLSGIPEVATIYSANAACHRKSSDRAHLAAAT